MLAGGYTVPQGDWGNFDVIAGFRISRSANVWNGIGGFRGRIRNSGFFIPYYFDIGAGGSNLTWQIASGVGASPLFRPGLLH